MSLASLAKNCRCAWNSHSATRLLLLSLFTAGSGAGVGVLSYQDSLKHILWRSILGFLPRTVLVRQYPHPGFSQTVVHLSETNALRLRTEPRVCGTLLQDRERHGCRARAHMDVLVASPEVRYRTTSAPLSKTHGDSDHPTLANDFYFSGY